MEMSKHTPGPWTRFGDEVYGGDGSRVAEAVAAKDMPLVLQAPEMYEALKALDTLFSPLVNDSTQACWIEKARAAIAKAEGAQ